MKIATPPRNDDARARYVPKRHKNFAHGKRPPVLPIWKIGQSLKQLDYLPIFASVALTNTVRRKQSYSAILISFPIKFSYLT